MNWTGLTLSCSSLSEFAILIRILIMNGLRDQSEQHQFKFNFRRNWESIGGK